MLGVDHRPRAWFAVVDGHAQHVRGQSCRGRGIDRPPDHTPRAHVQHHRAVHLALPRGVLGDIGNSQLVQALAAELPIHQVGRDQIRTRTPLLGAACDPCEAGLRRQYRHRAVPDM